MPVICQHLRSEGTRILSPEIYLYLNGRDVYQSFGLLPALDYLKVLSDILSKYAINKKRLYILGSSYGGYIGLLIGKLAPQTFQLIVENSAFSKTYKPDLYGKNAGMAAWRDLYGCKVQLTEDSPWSLDTEDKSYFDEHHDQIRSLLVEEHIYPSKTQYYCCHSLEDGLAPAEDKKLFKKIRPDQKIRLDMISLSDIDGKIFKCLDHGMRASLRGVFELAYNNLLSEEGDEGKTDFDLESHYVFPCSNGFRYEIKYSKNDFELKLFPAE